MRIKRVWKIMTFAPIQCGFCNRMIWVRLICKSRHILKKNKTFQHQIKFLGLINKMVTKWLNFTNISSTRINISSLSRFDTTGISCRTAANFSHHNKIIMCTTVTAMATSVVIIWAKKRITGPNGKWALSGTRRSMMQIAWYLAMRLSGKTSERSSMPLSRTRIVLHSFQQVVAKVWHFSFQL